VPVVAEAGRILSVISKDAALPLTPVRALSATGTEKFVADAVVLIAEDDEINTLVAVALVNKLGLRTATARNGREAVAMAAGYDYAAILMDGQMPEMDGFEATRQIRACERGRRVPIVAMTALTTPADRARCLDAGMDDVLSKPVDRDALRRTVERYVAREASASRTDTPSQEADCAPSGDGDGPRGAALDVVVISELRRVLTPAMRVKLFEVFDDQMHRTIGLLGAAADHGDGAEVARLGHLLVGSSAGIGARRLRFFCEQLERFGPADTIDVDEIDRLRVTAAQDSVFLQQELCA